MLAPPSISASDGVPEARPTALTPHPQNRLCTSAAAAGATQRAGNQLGTAEQPSSRQVQAAPPKLQLSEGGSSRGELWLLFASPLQRGSEAPRAACPCPGRSEGDCQSGPPLLLEPHPRLLPSPTGFLGAGVSARTPRLCSALSPLLPQFPPLSTDRAAPHSPAPAPSAGAGPPTPPSRSACGQRDMELIELRDLHPEPRPGRGRLERTNALRISPARRPGPALGSGAHPDPRLTAAPGAGHRFEPRRRGLHTWCDLCGDFIWGGGRKSLQCCREYRASGPLRQAPPWRAEHPPI